MNSDQALVPLTEPELRARRSLKWSRAGPDLIPADVAEADFAVPGPVREILAQAVALSDLGYPDFDSRAGGPRRLAEVFAERVHREFGVSAGPGRVEVCAQIMQALCCVLLAFSEPGDYVLVHEPAYPPILRAIEGLRRRPVTVPLPCTDSVAEFPADRRIAVIVLCNPHNPTGRIFSVGGLAALGDLAEQHGSVIFADEIHHDLTYEQKHRSIAAAERAAAGGAAGRTIMFTSAAKSFNIARLRCAVGHFGSSALHSRFRELPWHLRGGAGHLGIEATIAAWSACDAWLDAFRRQLRRNRDLVSDAIRASDCEYTPPEATYFAWINLSDHTSHTDNFAEIQRKVIIHSGTVFGQRYSGFARLNFAVPESRLNDVLSQVVQVLPSGNLCRQSPKHANELGVPKR
jgi:cystathionine beta-lyase